jgi:uncharacterized protein YbjT (DUF2867 family)
LLTSDAHAGQVYTLTGPESLSTPQRAAILAAVLGRPVAVEELSEAGIRAHMRSVRLGDDYIDVVRQTSEFIRAGGNAVLTDDVRQVLGRSPRTYAKWVAGRLGAFAAAD